MKRYIKILILSIGLMTLSSGVDLHAQCPMCKMAAESNLKHGGSAGKGLNTGILYIFVMPYLLVGTLGFVWYWNNKRNNQEHYLEEEYRD